MSDSIDDGFDNTDEGNLEFLRQEVVDYVNFRLGDKMMDMDLEPFHYDQALKKAVMDFRQLSSSATEESYSFLKLQTEVNEYILPKEIISVRSAARRNIGSTSTSNSTQFEPFEAGYLNMYMLQNGRAGGLLNYELFSQYQSLSARMFGGHVTYHFNNVTKKIVFDRKWRGTGEVIMLYTHNLKPEVMLLSDMYISPWLRDCTLAYCKLSLGEARSTFSSVPGPQGAGQMNGAELKTEGKEELERLREDIGKFVVGNRPLTFIIG